LAKRRTPPEEFGGLLKSTLTIKILNNVFYSDSYYENDGAGRVGWISSKICKTVVNARIANNNVYAMVR
jgi:hypothetical protein